MSTTRHAALNAIWFVATVCILVFSNLYFDTHLYRYYQVRGYTLYFVIYMAIFVICKTIVAITFSKSTVFDTWSYVVYILLYNYIIITIIYLVATYIFIVYFQHIKFIFLVFMERFWLY